MTLLASPKNTLAEPGGNQRRVAIVTVDRCVGSTAGDEYAVADSRHMKVVHGSIVDRDAEKMVRVSGFLQLENAAGEVERRIWTDDLYDPAHPVSLVGRAHDVLRGRQRGVERRRVVVNVVVTISTALVDIESAPRIDGATAGIVRAGGYAILCDRRWRADSRRAGLGDRATPRQQQHEEGQSRRHARGSNISRTAHLGHLPQISKIGATLTWQECDWRQTSAEHLMPRYVETDPARLKFQSFGKELAPNRCSRPQSNCRGSRRARVAGVRSSRRVLSRCRPHSG